MSGLARVVAERFSASPQAPAFLGALGPVDLAVRDRPTPRWSGMNTLQGVARPRHA